MKWADVIKQSLGLGDRRLSLHEERTAVRVPCRVPITVQSGGDTVVQGNMIDVSANGMRLEMVQNLGTQKRLQIVLKSRRPPSSPSAGIQLVRELHVQGDVAWAHRDRESNSWLVGVRAGQVRGTGGEDMVAFLRNELALNVLEDQQRRQFRRFHVPWMVEVVGPDGQLTRGAVKDISVCGLMFNCQHAFALNQELSAAIVADQPGTRILAQGIVKRCVVESHHLGWETAVAFLRLSDRDRAELTHALQRYLRKVPRGAASG